MTVTKINALVIFPFESASLTQAGRAGEEEGRVCDRGRTAACTDTSAQDAYVAGDNTAFGRTPCRVHLAKQLGGKGNIVALRGIPTTLDNERWTAFNARVEAAPTSSCSMPSTPTGTATTPSRSRRTTSRASSRSMPSGPPTTTWRWAC